MRRKAALVLLAGMLTLILLGCEEDKGGAARDTNTPATRGTAKQTPGVQPVPEGQGGAAGTTTPGGAPGAVAGEVATQQRNAYVQGAEQILNNIEQKFTAWQQQAGTQGQQNQQIQDLSKQVQTQLADARAAVNQMRTATGTQLKDAKVAADQAIRNLEAAFKDLQSQTGQTQVTQVE